MMEIESIVLERGFRQQADQPFPASAFSRGSMRDSNKEPMSEPIFRRNYNSFGGDDFHDDYASKKALIEWSGSAIEEDNYS